MNGTNETTRGQDDGERRRRRPIPGAATPLDGEPAAGQGGFGLVEALIAFVILAVGLLAIAGIALSVAAQTQGAAGTTARSLAGQQVLEVTASAGYGGVAVGTTDTTIAVGNRTFTVTRTVEQPTIGTKKVTVQVPDGGDASYETMVTYLSQPQNAPLPPP